MYKCWGGLHGIIYACLPSSALCWLVPELPLAAWIATIKEMRHFVFQTALWLFPTLTQECLAAELSIFLPGHPTAVQKVICHGEEGKSMHFKKPALVSPRGQNVTCTEYLNLNMNPLGSAPEPFDQVWMREFFFENNLKLFLSPQLNSTQLPKYERSSVCFWEGVGLALEEMRRDEGFDTSSCRSDPAGSLSNGTFLGGKKMEV